MWRRWLRDEEGDRSWEVWELWGWGVLGRRHGWSRRFCNSSHLSCCLPRWSPYRPGWRHPVWDLGGVRGGGGGIPNVFSQLLPPCICLYHHDNWGRRESGDSLTPGGNRKHHLHFAHSPAHHSRLTRFTQSAGMWDCWELWSRPALLFSEHEIRRCLIDNKELNCGHWSSVVRHIKGNRSLLTNTSPKCL